ncbi:MAG TPA: serine hydrolase [Verrucomicrobiales bacterium]|nr:D-alanyl-D-alanine carboxypeptidase [Verrucomicrobiae bacterium]MCP5552708.1 D-alanyl-D-alanine carboxypeptidase [Akkermansiaceae bacterium]HRX53043.1 serine hydrolase [Verrucomicrobiales bacterium]
MKPGISESQPHRPGQIAVYCFAILQVCWLALPTSLRAQSSASYIVVDATQKKILLEGEPDRKLPVASLTKVATATVAMDWVDARNGDRSEMMTVPYSVGSLGGANPLGLAPGDQITLRDALYSALLASDNACALTIADHIGREMMQRTGGPDPVSVFVTQMNALAATQGMSRTRFVDPHGLSANGYSTAKDLARLMIYAMRNASFNFICSQQTRRVAYVRQGQSMAFDIKTTNQLLGQMGVDGGKTGSTAKAGECLILTVRKPDRISDLPGGMKRRVPYRLVIVELASSDRFGQGRLLIQQGWNAYENWLASGLVVKDAKEMLTTPTR